MPVDVRTIDLNDLKQLAEKMKAANRHAIAMKEPIPDALLAEYVNAVSPAMIIALCDTVMSLAVSRAKVEVFKVDGKIH